MWRWRWIIFFLLSIISLAGSEAPAYLLATAGAWPPTQTHPVAHTSSSAGCGRCSCRRMEMYRLGFSRRLQERQKPPISREHQLLGLYSEATISNFNSPPFALIKLSLMEIPGSCASASSQMNIWAALDSSKQNYIKGEWAWIAGCSLIIKNRVRLVNL